MGHDSCHTAHCHACAPQEVRTDPRHVTVDLDLPAASRWDSAVQQIVDEHGWGDSFGRVCLRCTSTLCVPPGHPHRTPPHQAEQHINDMLGKYRLLLDPYWELLKLPAKYQVGSVLLGQACGPRRTIGLAASCTAP